MFTPEAYRRVRRVLVSMDLAILIGLITAPLLWLLGDLSAYEDDRIPTPGLSLTFKIVFLVLMSARMVAGITLGAKGVDAAGLWKRKPYPQLIMAAMFFSLFFGGFDWGLRKSGFEANLPPVIFEGKDDQGGRVIPDTLTDPELLWKFKPGSMFHGRPINSLGFRERESDPVKKPGTTRIMCMGDSVTAQGHPSYSQYLHDLLQEKPPGPGAWEAFNVGVHGYAILQGSILFDRLDPILNPDIVTIFFGWNGHWLDRTPLSQQMGVRMGSWTGHAYEILQRSRVFCFLIVKLNPLKPLMKPQSSDWVLRVPPDQYRESLADLVRKVRASDATPVIITAPRRELTRELLRKNYARNLDEAEATHDQYIEITRQVAAAEQAPLFDLSRILEGQENDSLFAADGIHFDHYMTEGSLAGTSPDQPGLERIGVELHDFICKWMAGKNPPDSSGQTDR